MALPNYLSRIKSAGVYRYVWDKSIIPESQEQSLRICVGFSERGPFNTPVYFDSKEEFVKVFGNVSRRMERKGVFFHRLCLQSLDAGPILALNLKPFTNETSKMLTFNASDIKLNKSVTLKNVKATHKIVDGEVVSCTQEELADATHAYVEGEYRQVTNPKPIGDATYPKYGTVTLDAAAQTWNKNLMADALIALDGINSPTEWWKTIYDTNRFWKVSDDIMKIASMTREGTGQWTGTVVKDYMRIVQTGSKEDSVTVFIRPYVPTGYDIKISDWYSSETQDEMPSYMESIRDHYLSEFFAEIYVFRGDFRSKQLFSHYGTLGSYPMGTVVAKNSDAELEQKWMPFMLIGGESGTEVDGDGKPVVMSNPHYKNAFGQTADALDAMSDVDTANFIGKYQGILFPSFNDANGTCISLDAVFNEDYKLHKCVMQFNEELLDDAYEADLDNNGVYDADGAQGPEAAPSVPDGVTNDGSVASFVHELCSCVHPLKAGKDGSQYEDYDAVEVPPTCAAVYGWYLEGYQYITIPRNLKGRDLIEGTIMPVLTYKGIYEALTNSVDVEWHYWIDTFQTYPGVSMKSDIAAICKKKFNTLGILNFPPMVECAVQMGYPGLEGGFDMKEVVNRSSGISLPSETQGASWVAYYTQLKMTDGSYTFTIPSAALVGNLYMQKYSQYHPYDIIAGTNKGCIRYSGVVGPDYNYARADIDQLEPFGVNCITHIPRYGIIINSNQTAKQTPVSALSKAHIRELVTYIQDEIEHMFRKYWWELNTATLRANVKAKADTILEVVKGNGGVYAYSTKCDDTNNTSEMIDNEILLLDVEIEPARGAGKMVQTLTLRRTGALAGSAGGNTTGNGMY